jgi:hypothetical protein
LIGLAAVTVPLHQHNHDTPGFSLVIFLPCFLDKQQSSKPSQKQLVLIWKWQVQHGSFIQERIGHLYRLGVGWDQGSQNPSDWAYPCCVRSLSRRDDPSCGHVRFRCSFGLRRSART